MDFIKSDLQARAMLIKASFDLFTIMQRRGIQVRTIATIWEMKLWIPAELQRMGQQAVPC